MTIINQTQPQRQIAIICYLYLLEEHSEFNFISREAFKKICNKCYIRGQNVTEVQKMLGAEVAPQEVLMCGVCEWVILSVLAKVLYVVFIQTFLFGIPPTIFSLMLTVSRDTSRYR